eukprot:c24331_g1_i1 orf=384-1697(-)
MEVWPSHGTDKANPWLPPGFRFHPTDEELVTYYLAKKVQNAAFMDRAITDVDLNKCEPWDLPGKAQMGEKEWYFYSLRDRKYPTGLRTNRATEAGYWKATGKDREVMSSHTSCLVGMKKTLVFYRGRAPKGEKTNWVMHEYRLEGNHGFLHRPKTTKDEWVVCRIFQKSVGGKKIPFEITRPYHLDDLSSSLPPLLDSPHPPSSSMHEDGAWHEREASQHQMPLAGYNQGFYTLQRTAECLRYEGLSDMGSLAISSPYAQPIYNSNQSSYTQPVFSSFCIGQETGDMHQPSATPHVTLPSASIPLNSCIATSLPSNAILKSLVDQYSNIGDLDMRHPPKIEPYFVPQSADKIPSKLPESGSFLSGDHLQYDVLATTQSQLQQQNRHQNLEDQCDSHLRDERITNACQETQRNAIGERHPEYPAGTQPSVDLESIWTY